MYMFIPLLLRTIPKHSILIPFLFLDDGNGFRIVQNGSRQKT